VYLTGKPSPGVGPQDIALAIIGAVFERGYVKNKVMEFVGPGVATMSTDFRNSVDVMTTETTCLSSIWQTDEETKTTCVFTAGNKTIVRSQQKRWPTMMAA
jgi:aconitate hydratase